MNDKLQSIINVANKYGHHIVRIRLDDDSMIYECSGGTPHGTGISEYLKGEGVSDKSGEYQALKALFNIQKDWILDIKSLKLPLDCYDDNGNYIGDGTEYKQIESSDDIVEWAEYAISHDFEELNYKIEEE